MSLEQQLSHIVTRWDRRQSTRKGYNPYALAIYLGRCEDIAREVAAGATLQKALEDNFNDRLLDFVKKAMGIADD